MSGKDIWYYKAAGIKAILFLLIVVGVAIAWAIFGLQWF